MATNFPGRVCGLMVVYRFGRWRYTIPWRWLRMPFSFLYKVLKPISEILTGIELPCEATLGRRFRIDHFGAIVISGDAVFGDDCVVRNGVTVGLRTPAIAVRRLSEIGWILEQAPRFWARSGSVTMCRSVPMLSYLSTFRPTLLLSGFRHECFHEKEPGQRPLE